MAEIAQEKGVTIIAGSLPLRHAGKVYNSAVVIDHQGQVAAHYDKIHLFSMTGEERFFAPGSARTIFSLGDTTAGLAICYDLRFPELFRALTLDGAQIIFLPAVWPLARKDHWHTLIRARAIENQVYFCAVNCVGHYRGSDFYGHSLLVGPSGETIAGGGAEEAIVYGEFNQDVVTACRQKMQVWHDRRPEVYR
jgi:predicted amidohydrolase